MALVYTTLAGVRREAGFTNNPNVDDILDITPHAESAEGEVETALSGRYSLPMSGNAAWTGSRGEAYIKGIATRLAASFLLLQTYEDEAMKVDQYKKISSIRSSLKNLMNGTIKLFGTDGVEFAIIATSSPVIGFPVSVIANPPRNTMNQIF